MSLKPRFGTHSADDLASMEPMKLLQIQVSQSNSLESRIEGLKKVTLVASVLSASGKNRVRKELMPWLKAEFLDRGRPDHDEDEVLLCLASQLGSIGPYLGNGVDKEENLKDLLNLLESLCCIEETVVRNEAVKSIQKIVGDYYVIGNATDSSQLVEMCRRLASSDWFPSKVCASGVLPSVYLALAVANEANSSQEFRVSTSNKLLKIRQHLYSLSVVENPLVRRSCAKHLADLIKSLCKENVHHEDVLPVYRGLIGDESDTVRLLAVTATPAMSTYLKTLNPTFYNIEVLTIVRSAVTDQSWRVRDAIGKCFGEIITALASKPQHISYLCTAYASLLTDGEAEVRASTVGCLGTVTSIACATNGSSYSPIASVLPKLGNDNIMEVRRNLAREIMNVAPDLNQDFVLKTYKTILEQLLTDEFPEVQLAVLTALPNLAPLLPKTPTLVSSLLAMTSASNWRVRHNCALMLSSLCEYIGERFYLENLASPFYNFILDPVAEVRGAVVTASSNLAEVCGPEWCSQHVFPSLLRVYDDHGAECYLTRSTVLQCAAALIASHAETPDEQGLFEEVLTFLINGLSDNVANVRLIAARCLGNLILIQSGTFSYIRAIDALNTVVAEDQDEDCKYFCQRALDSIS